jgi:hypothetical protein
MEFMQSGPDIVRSNTQRWLLDCWAKFRGHGSLPIWPGLNPGDFTVPLENLAVIQIVGDAGDMRFRIEFHGKRLVEAFGPVDCVGKCLDEILPPAYQSSALATYRQVANGKAPVYTVADMRDSAGRIVHHERLLLPFSMGGTDVERILASIEAASPEGPFELRDLMKSPIRPPVIALCATIQY